MKEWMHKVELVVDKLIPPMLVALLFLIIIEIFFEEFAHTYEFWIVLADYIVISVFVLDVLFKYIRIKPFKKFLKESWLDIIAIFPFALLFRFVEGFFEIFALSEIVKESQSVLHEATHLEKEAGKIVKEVERAGKVARTTRFARFIRPVARAPRFVKAFAFYEKPTGKHHPHEKRK
ncbi:ion transporter [Candidatus Woesearchaeota archaeon]|nr:ion transporter [Candidatus Woesearchaeota archaeon]